MSRAGGLLRIKLYGNPGTPEGRRRGGLHSQEKQRTLNTKFKSLKKIHFPRNSVALAELLGILAGDGYIGEYQVSVATNSSTDLEHARYTKALFEKIFKVEASLSFRSDCKACVVTVSSRDLGSVLVKKGMKRGHKIRNNLCMPDWIGKNKNYKKAFIRGLFDTDGSVYLDTHRINGKLYKNIAMLFTNRCLPLLANFKATTEELGLHPTQKTDFAVFLRRKEEIRRYFSLVGSSNPKHLQKVEAYFRS